jgi:hypothetical protein
VDGTVSATINQRLTREAMLAADVRKKGGN